MECEKPTLYLYLRFTRNKMLQTKIAVSPYR
jgi:hypothetical protein